MDTSTSSPNPWYTQLIDTICHITHDIPIIITGKHDRRHVPRLSIREVWDLELLNMETTAV